MAQQPSQASPGDTITITGAGYQLGEAIKIWLLSTPVQLTTTQADAGGTFSAQVTIPSGTAPGAHHLEVRAELSGTVSNALTVTEALAGNGANIAGSASTAALLMLAGMAVLVARRPTV